MEKCARLGGLLLLCWVSVGCGSVWSPFLAYRAEDDSPVSSDGSTSSDGSMTNPDGSAAQEVRPSLVLVPKGSFTMGSPTTEPYRQPGETPHTVMLTKDFWMTESEVTQRQYRNLMGSSPSQFQGDELPVERVGWLEAVAYCNALSVKEGFPTCYQVNEATVGWADGVRCTGYRLPTEAEWEYAANPENPPRTVYAGSDSPDAVAWHNGNAGNTTHPVKTKAANGRGLYDLSGNVWEWIWDFSGGSYGTAMVTDPTGPATGTARGCRGGSWDYPSSVARVAMRNENDPKGGTYALGFRVVRSAP